MKATRSQFVTTAVLAALVPAGARAAAGGHGMAQATKILVIRHGEKPNGSSALGITADGTPDPESLIVLGWQRAGALVPLFDPASALPRPGLAVPQKLYASSPMADGS
ncbi:MAG TPA: hypothetical protein VME66_14860, partial [Candidatus Acidoferrales bacterium]|nr:hypothetical protein [Candidatus Acidoferrales bacterium]